MINNDLSLEAGGEKAIEETVKDVLKVEATGKAPEPRVRKAKAGGHWPAVKKAEIQVEEITTPLEVEPAPVFISAFTIEENNVEVPEAKIVIESEAPKAEDAEAEKAARSLIASQNRAMVRQLRKTDPAKKKTCAQCFKRVPNEQIGFGHAEVCDTCLGR